MTTLGQVIGLRRACAAFGAATLTSSLVMVRGVGAGKDRSVPQGSGTSGTASPEENGNVRGAPATPPLSAPAPEDLL